MSPLLKKKPEKAPKEQSKATITNIYIKQTTAQHQSIRNARVNSDGPNREVGVLHMTS